MDKLMIVFLVVFLCGTGTGIVLHRAYVK